MGDEQPGLQASRNLRAEINTQINKGVRECRRDAYGAFCGHTIEDSPLDPGLDITGVGRLSTPFYDRDIDLLVAKGTDAGDSCWTIDAKDIVFRHPKWQEKEASILATVYSQLGVKHSRDVRVEKDKLLILRPGSSHYLPVKRVTKKFGGMQPFAQLAICLPSLHRAGKFKCKLEVDNEVRRMTTDNTSEWAYSYTTWVREADTRIAPITSGTKVVLLYNLMFIGDPWNHPSHSHFLTTKYQIKTALENWFCGAAKVEKMPKYITYTLSQYYGGPDIRLNSLKGVDAVRVRHLSQLCDELDWLCLLTTIERNEHGTKIGGIFHPEDADTTIDDLTTLDGIHYRNGFDLDDEELFVPPEPWKAYVPDEVKQNTREDYTYKYRKTVRNPCQMSL